jgi:hypothetical protein
VGAAIFSTAEDGAVVLDTDGVGVEMSTWTGRTMTFTNSLSTADANVKSAKLARNAKGGTGVEN